MVGMTSRFRSSYRAAFERLRAGSSERWASFGYCNYRIRRGVHAPVAEARRYCGGGMFLQMGIHNLDRAVWLRGALRNGYAAIRDRCGNWADETGRGSPSAGWWSPHPVSDGTALRRKGE